MAELQFPLDERFKVFVARLAGHFLTSVLKATISTMGYSRIYYHLSQLIEGRPADPAFSGSASEGDQHAISR
jgi:hypothetical protein